MLLTRTEAIDHIRKGHSYLIRSTAEYLYNGNLLCKVSGGLNLKAVMEDSVSLISGALFKLPTGVFLLDELGQPIREEIIFSIHEPVIKPVPEMKTIAVELSDYNELLVTVSFNSNSVGVVRPGDDLGICLIVDKVAYKPDLRLVQ